MMISIRHAIHLLLLAAVPSLLAAVPSLLLAEPPDADRIRDLIQPRDRETALEAYRALSKTKQIKRLLSKSHRKSIKPCRAQMYLIQYRLPPRAHQRSTQNLPDAGAQQASGRIVWRQGSSDLLDTGAASASFVHGSRLVLASWYERHKSHPCEVLHSGLLDGQRAGP